jgi:uncharacterized protein
MKKIIISGGTGFIGRNLIKFLKSGDYCIYNISRDIEKSRAELPLANEHLDVNDENKMEEAIGNSNAVINLSGASVGSRRWTSKYKKIIYNSRIKTTQKIVEYINKSNNPPKLLINASAIGYYGNRENEILTEDSKAGHDFLAKVCVDWEAEALKAQDKTRIVCIRTGIVLDKNEGALAKMLTPYTFYIGGPLGSGSQWMPWIHIHDLISLCYHIIENDKVTGAVNMCSPNPVTMRDFAKALGKFLRKPSFFKVPSFALKFLLGEQSQIVLEGQRAIPEKALNSGFKFEFEYLKDALDDVIKS